MNILLLRHNLHRWFLDRGDDVYLVADAASGTGAIAASTLTRFAGVYRIRSYDSVEELSSIAADILARRIPIDRIAAFTETTQYARGYLSDLLGLPPFSAQLALATRDKRIMKRRAVDAGIPVAKWISIPVAEGADLEQIRNAVGYPLVLKPANGSGVSSTIRVDNHDQLARALAGFEFAPKVHSEQLIAEEFINGDEYHADAVWRDGNPWMFQLGRYFAPFLQQWATGGILGSVGLREEEHSGLFDEVRAIYKRFMHAVGLTSGATHFELFREHGTGRVVFGELASRVPGSSISDMMELKCGVDLGSATAHELVGGRIDELNFTESSFRNVGFLNILPHGNGRILRLPTREELLADPNIGVARVVMRVGDKVNASERSRWCVLLAIGAESEDALTAAAQRIVGQYHVDVG
jgi:biotin carboxylase